MNAYCISEKCLVYCTKIKVKNNLIIKFLEFENEFWLISLNRKLEFI